MKKAIVWLIILAVLFFIGYRGWEAYKKTQVKKPAKIEETSFPVKVEVVSPTTLIESLTLTGDVREIEEVDVFPKVSGKLIELKVEEGDRVKKDEILAVIDRDITGVKFEPAEVAAPVEGIVGRVYLDKGAAVNPPTPSPSMGTPLVRIVNMDSVKVVINVIEKDLPKIKTGQKAKIRVEAYPNEIFYGKVNLVSPVVNLLTRTATVEIGLANPNHALKPGMFADVEIIIGEKKEAVLIPSYAVLEMGEKNKVFIISGGKTKEKEVSLGLSGSDRVEVKEGINPGDSLIVAGQHSLKDGDLIRIVGGGEK